jgi:hypothetical protein
MHTYVHTLHKYIRTYIHYIHTYIHTLRTFIHTLHTYIHTYMHTYIYKYINKYIYTHKHIHMYVEPYVQAPDTFVTRYFKLSQISKWELLSYGLLRSVEWFNSLSTFRDNLSVPSSKVKRFWISWPSNMGPDRLSRNVGKELNYSTLRNNPEERRSQLS